MNDTDPDADVDRIENGYDYDERRVFRIDGDAWVVGIDQYGCVSIEHGEIRHAPVEASDGEDGTEAVFYASDNGQHYAPNFPPEMARDLAAYIEELTE